MFPTIGIWETVGFTPARSIRDRAIHVLIDPREDPGVHYLRRISRVDDGLLIGTDNPLYCDYTIAGPENLGFEIIGVLQPNTHDGPQIEIVAEPEILEIRAA